MLVYVEHQLWIVARIPNAISHPMIVFDNPLSAQVRAYDILHFSYELAQLTRAEDCIGRLGVNEVVIIVRDGKENADLFVHRLHEAASLTVNDTLQIKIGLIFGNKDENSLELLERLGQTDLVSR